MRSLILAGAVVAGTIIHLAAQAPAGPVLPRNANPLQVLNARASAAKTGSDASIRELTDFVFDRFVGLEVPGTSPLRRRVFEADRAFRNNGHSAIREEQLVTAMNTMVADLHGPTWARTNQAQVRMFRMALRSDAPQLVGTRPSGRGPFGISDEMSPVEAIFVGMYLVNGKLWDESYRKPPDEWVRGIREAKQRARERRRAGELPTAGGQRGRPANHQPSRELMALVDTINTGLTNEGSAVSAQAADFLDRLGFAR